jgi:cytochrome b
MSKQLVWDAPTRLFHGLFAAGFIAASLIALLLDDDSKLFPYHAIIGLAITLMVCLRVVWGIVGSKYSRFTNFAFGPEAVARYLKGAIFGGARRYIGHNPGSAYATFAMLALMLGLAFTGIMIGQGVERLKEVHEVLAYVMVGVVSAHVLGVVLHMIRHRENIATSMIYGRKVAEPGDGIRSSHPILAGVFLAVIGAWSIGLMQNFDPATRRIRVPVFGTSLQIGDAENNAKVDSD